MPLRIVIAGGGTGGHIYPGIALAKEFMKHDSEIEITFVGSNKGLESKVVPREGFEFHPILAGGLVGKKGIQRWSSWLKLPASIGQSLCFLVRKKPDLVVGVGGYASGPLALSAGLLRIPLVIHEQNAIPGVTNKWLGKIANKIAISFKQSRQYFSPDKVIETGNMIREEIGSLGTNTDNKFGNKFCVLIFGGSQGAQSINRAVLEALPSLRNQKDSIHFIHQTGNRDIELVKQTYSEHGFSAEVEPFFYDMAEQYRKASLVICRAGATSIAEITAAGKVSILIPFPHAAHNHQEKNAEVLDTEKAANVIYDRDLNGEKIAQAISDGMESPEKLKEMEANSSRLGNKDAAQKVRELCLDLLNETNELKARGL
jgi:UDP-N-acetylglucosamine--N-acetylmuramyl-(pentapeptide) pyrophosphoryl-undecaprenol N-acetylglucosamine transferase